MSTWEQERVIGAQLAVLVSYSMRNFYIPRLILLKGLGALPGTFSFVFLRQELWDGAIEKNN
jgi:hypothetical protein